LFVLTPKVVKSKKHFIVKIKSSGDIVLQETIQLEKLRQGIEDAEYEAGNQSDYIDRGRPNEGQARSAREQIARMVSKSNKLKSELHELILVVHRDKPQALEEWVKLHKDILGRILAEKETDSNTRIRHNLAREALQAWEKVLARKQEFVSINWH
jgi:hypothetical protein